MEIKLIAPCGMNCNLCSAYLRDKQKCPSCRGEDVGKNKYCINCIIKNCEHLEKNNWKYCTEKCEKYPCKRLNSLDKRYRTKYNMSMIENLEYIEKHGIRKFLKNEKNRWIRGDEVFCVHQKKYYRV
jgi:hypothetical protein